MNRIFLFTVFAAILFYSCGDQFDVSQLPIENNNNSIFGDTSYVILNPNWTGFNKPRAICIGHEPLIYVANTGNNEIICIDLFGKELGRSAKIKNPVAICQDFKLNLIVCGEFDTIINNVTITYGAIYKIRLFDAQNDISKARIERVYFESGKPNRRFTGVAVMSNNSYYITRNGPDNSSVIDPDMAVLLMNENNTIFTPISNLKPNGTGLESISELSGITVVNPKKTDFIFTQTGDVSLFKVQWITYIQTQNFGYYASKFSPSKDGDIDLLKINFFKKPMGIAVDNNGNIFVVDAVKDSLYRFSSKGISRYSFGGSGLVDGKFNHPSGVAYFDKTLYIADTDNNRIVRFMLSTDIR